MIERHGEHFLTRILTAAERERLTQFNDPVTFVAGRWAAKEALMKMIGTGWRGQIAWTDMEILPNHLGEPIVALSGEMERLRKELSLSQVTISITHTKQQAAAVAIGLGD